MKSLFQSKVFWLAIIQSLIGAAVVFETAYPAVGAIVIAKSGLDIALRIVTASQIKL